MSIIISVIVCSGYFKCYKQGSPGELSYDYLCVDATYQWQLLMLQGSQRWGWLVFVVIYQMLGIEKMARKNEVLSTICVPVQYILYIHTGVSQRP